MRRSALSAVLAATLSLFACSDQPTEAPTGTLPITRSPASLVVCTAAGIQAQIDALFPAGGLRTSAQAQFSSIPKAVDKATGTAARDKTIAIVDFLLTTYYAGQLTGGLSTATFDQVLDLIKSLYCFAGLASPDLPSTTGGSDVVVVLVSPGDPTTTVVTPSEHAAVTIPKGGVSQPTLVAISLLPDDPPPLRTSLDQYPLFYHFSGTTATGPVTFTLDVTAGVCLRDNIAVPDANLRLAHNVGPLFGDVEILPRPASVPGLDCTDLGSGGLSGSMGSWGENRFAWAKKLLLPAELHAASVALVTLGVGGTTKKFSEFGVVEPGSNPGKLSIVTQSGAPASGNVSGSGTVYVKAASGNGTPIRDVPVDFDGTIVLTNGSGIAAFEWTEAEPGASLRATVPNEASCPAIPPEATPAYRPRVCFTPSSVTFTTNTLVDYGSGGYSFILIGSNAPSDVTPTYPGESWFSRSFSPGGAWGTGPAPFGYSAAGCSIYTSHPVATPWAAAAGAQADPSTGSGLLLRKEFKTPTGFNGNVSVNIAIDNDIRVYLDGHDVTNAEGVFSASTNTDAVNGFWFGYVAPFQAHGGCAQQGDGTFTVPRSHLDVGDQHLLAVYAHDWGGASYADVQVKLDVSD